MKINTRTLAGITLLASLVVVLDYTMKFSGLKIPFPWLPTLKLKFDFTGIPIVLSLLLFSFIPGMFTSTIAFVAILARSGDVASSLMKALAELFTIIGMTLALKKIPKFKRGASLILGIVTRCFAMFFFNLIVLSTYYNIPFAIVLEMSPLIAAFNAIQGSISILGGYSIYEAIKKRVPSLVNKPNKS